MSDPRDDEALILEIRDRYTAAKGAWKDIQEEGDIDMRYVAGDPWDPKDKRAREAAKRPVLALDELSQYFNQTINDVRANARAVKFTPKGNGANDQSAEFYANKWRDIEYQSHASLAYITAFENCVQRSFGWTKVLTKYVDAHVPPDAPPDPRYLYQDLWIEPVPNPNMILPDPMWKRPEISDINFLFETEVWRKNEFKREFGKEAQFTDFSPEFVREHSLYEWVKDDTVLVAGYWKREKEGSRRLLVLKPGEGEQEPRAVWWPGEVDADGDTIAKRLKIPADRIHGSRVVDDYKVTHYLTNGAEVLKVEPWLGRYIPFSACTGKTIYVDRGAGPKREILSMTRLARDPYMLYCYIRALEMETVGMVTKFPYFFYEGQLSPEMLKKLAESLHKPIAGIAVKPMLPGLNPGTPLPFPQRNLLAPDLQAYEVFAEAARRAIQAAMGVSPLPTAAQRRNDKSGVALKEIGRQEQLGSFHFANHHDDHVRHVGIIGEDLLDKVLDTVRDVSVRDEFEKSQPIHINDPEGSVYKQGQLSGDPVFTKGDHLVTVSAGPSVESQREAVSDFVGTLSQDQNVMGRAGDIIVRIQAKTANLGPLMDELADRLKPPDVQAQEQQEEGGPPDPKVLMGQLAQQGQQLKASQDAIAQLTMEIKTKQQEYEQQRITKKMELDAKAALELELQRRELAAKIEVARITAAKQTADQAAEAFEERLALAHDADQAALDRQHDVNLAAIDHAATLEQADQAHGQALEQGQQGIAGTLAGQAQQATLTPPAGGTNASP